MIYTEAMREAVKRLAAPNDFVVDIVEYDEYPPFLGIQFYQSQWEHYNEDERLRCVAYLVNLRQLLMGFGANVTLDPIADDGKNLPTNRKGVR